MLIKITEVQIQLKLNYGEKRKRIDITEQIKILYGENNNWNQRLYKYDDVFPDKDSHINIM